MYKLGRHPLFYFAAAIFALFISSPAAAMPAILPSGQLSYITFRQAEIDAVSSAKKRGGPGEETEFLFSTGYRVDDFNWNIAGDIYGNNPNILSELTWNDIEIYQIKFHFKTILHGVCYLRGSSGFGWIFNGESQDSDYSGDNRTSEFSRSINSADDGNILDVSLGIGYQFTFRLDSFGITPLIGYSYHRQNLTITNGIRIIPPTDPFPGLDSTYVAEWNGPFLGLDFTLKLNNKHTVFAEIEYHWANYYAKADWNLRSDFAHPKSFEHVCLHPQ